MRAKVLLSTVGLAAAILAPAIYFHFKSDQPIAANPAPTATSETASETKAAAPSLLSRVEHRPNNADVAPAASSFQFSNDPDEVKSQLIDLGMSRDPSTLPAILSQVESPNTEVVQIALQATRELRDADAIPTLQRELSYSRPPEELVEIQKTIEYLQLPTFGSGGDVASQSTSQ